MCFEGVSLLAYHNVCNNNLICFAFLSDEYSRSVPNGSKSFSKTKHYDNPLSWINTAQHLTNLPNPPLTMLNLTFSKKKLCVGLNYMFELLLRNTTRDYQTKILLGMPHSILKAYIIYYRKVLNTRT